MIDKDEIYDDLHEELKRRARDEGFESDDPVVELLQRANTLLDEAVLDIMRRARLGSRAA